MQRLPVESSDIVSIGYDAKARVLEVEFREHRVYQYLDVAPEVHERFMRADSFGDYFDTYVKRQYRFTKMDTEPKTVAPEVLTFVTGNQRKLRDLQLACEPYGIIVEGLELPVDEVQSHDAEEIAIKKAKQAYALAGRPVVVNDTYWHILALRGFPGAYMSYVAQWLKAEDFLTLMKGKTERSVNCTDTLVYYDGKHSKVFSQVFWGKIIDEPRGDGPSIDKIVVMAGHTETIAEVENTKGRSSVDPQATSWHDFAKWYNLRRRIATIPTKGAHNGRAS